MQVYVHLMYLRIYAKFCAIEPIGALKNPSWRSDGRDEVLVAYKVGDIHTNQIFPKRRNTPNSRKLTPHRIEPDEKSIY